MAELVFTEGFALDFTQVELESKREEILEFVGLLADYPEIGSRDLPPSIREVYGANVRKLIVDPFDVLYEYDEKSDEALIYGLVHQRAIR